MSPGPVPSPAPAPATSADGVVDALRRETLDVLRGVLAGETGRPYALLDFPCFANVGDNAIWLGALGALREVGLSEPVYTCDNRTFQPALLARRVGDGPILLAGGGNFGDLFRKHQRLREEVVASFPRNRVVQLPQSIHFESSEAMERARRVMSAHPRLTVLARDRESLETARNDLGLEAVLCPDLAFALGRLPSGRAPGEGVLWIARRDAWSLHAPPPPGPDVRVSDWPSERLSLRRARVRLLSSLLRRGLAPAAASRGALSRTYEPLARWRLRRAMAWMGRARVVVTDRLHGHVLALLAGVPHVVLDDATGKVRRFHAAWTRGAAGVAFAEGPDEALRTARRLLAGDGVGKAVP